MPSNINSDTGLLSLSSDSHSGGFQVYVWEVGVWFKGSECSECQEKVKP